MSWSTNLPEPLAGLLPIEFDMDQIDYEPYDELWPASENADWLAAWTGNADADSTVFRVFGMDGSGGQVALWLIHADKDLLEQPVVFLGSEGEVGVVARDLWDYMWLLAQGIGPYEAVEYGADLAKVQPDFMDFAKRTRPDREASAADILAAAKAAYPGFSALVDGWCS